MNLSNNKALIYLALVSVVRNNFAVYKYLYYVGFYLLSSSVFYLDITMSQSSRCDDILCILPRQIQLWCLSLPSTRILHFLYLNGIDELTSHKNSQDWLILTLTTNLTLLVHYKSIFSFPQHISQNLVVISPWII